VQNLPEMWIRRNEAFQPIISPEIFYKTRTIIQDRSHRFTNEEILDLLRKLLEREGCLSGILIDEAEGMGSSSVCSSRFQSLITACKLIGYNPERDYRYTETNRELRRMHPQIVSDTCLQF
jgi:hypothetical protein